MRIIRCVLILAALSVVWPCLGAASATPVAPRQPSHPAAGLFAGQILVAGSARDSLTNGQFELRVDAENLTLWQTTPMEGRKYPSTWSTGVWFDGDRQGWPYRGKSVLRMQRDGNLVMRTRLHKLIWQTGTHGRDNHLQLRRNGALVVVDCRGHTVWSAHTHAALLGDGHSLPPGGYLNDRWGDFQGGPLARLTMRRSGNVVLQCNGHTVWSTHTHRPGSELSLLRTGNLVVRAPDGTIMWRSHSRSHAQYSVLDGPGLEIENDRPRTVWAGRQHRSRCDPYI